MKCCQLCGICSWGPLRRDDEEVIPPVVLTMMTRDLHLTRESFKRCDNCGSVGAVALLQDDLKSTFPPGFGSSPDPIPAILAAVMPMFQSKVETRTERLVKAILSTSGRQGSSQSTEEFAAWIVYAVRCIEFELDKAPPLQPDAEFAPEPVVSSAGLNIDRIELVVSPEAIVVRLSSGRRHWDLLRMPQHESGIHRMYMNAQGIANSMPAEGFEPKPFPEGSTGDGGAGIRWSFASRDTFVQWLLPVVDRAREKMSEEGVPADFNINRLAKHIADEVMT